MPARAIVNVDLNDDKFKAFQASFNKFNDQLSKLPDAWKKVNAVQGEQEKGFQSIAAAMMAQLELLRRQEKAERDATRSVREQQTAWQAIANLTKGVYGNIASATTQLLKWTALTTVFSGIIGAGGLFGIDRLAGSVASGRRSSLGLGIGYGEQAAFGVNFGRLVDPQAYLGAVNEAQTDVTKRYALYGAGLHDRDINGKDTAQVGSALLGQLKRIVDATPEALLAQTLQARGLSQFLSLQDAQRLRNTSPSELAQLQAGFGRDQGTLGLSPANQRTWQDFSTQLSRAGSTIENVFVKGLTGLIDPLNHLSASVTHALEVFLGSDKLKTWIDELGVGLEKLAGYVGSDDFDAKIKQFVEAVSEIADATVRLAGWIAHPFGGGYSDQQINSMYGGSTSKTPGAAGGSTGSSPRGSHNPGNLRPPGSATGFQNFATDEDGYKAMQRQLMLYYNRDHLSSVAQIINKWAPPSENDTRAYIGDVAKRMGVGQMDSLNLNDPETMSKLVAAMAHHENSKNNIAPSNVKVMIYGAPGGNTIANAQQATSNQ